MMSAGTVHDKAEKRGKQQLQVPQQLDTRLLASPSEFRLGVRGSKVALQYPHLKVRGSSYTVSSAKPSRIPKPVSPSSRPLPPSGYIVRSTDATDGKNPPRVLSSPPYSSSSPPTPNPWQEVPRIRVTQTLRPRQNIPTGLVVKTESQMMASRKPASKQTPAVGRGRQESSDKKRRSVKAGREVGGRSVPGGRREVGGRNVPGFGAQYNWNGNGRLEELKIRYLARKYLTIWARRVFGRVLPSAARLHRETAVRRCVFSVWHEQWWVVRREWKLSIRADCHNRYRLWQSVWKAWMQYVQAAKEKRRKTETAAKFALLKRRRLAWRIWCEYVMVRREKRRVQHEVDQWAATRTVRCTWTKWTSALQARRQLKVMNTLALHHWAYQLQKRTWLCWLVCYRERQVTSQKATIAGAHYRHQVLGTCWSAWQVYMDHRRGKAQLRGVATDYHSRGVVVKYFHLWRLRYLRVRQIAEFEGLVAEKGRQAKLRRALTSWRYYVELQRYRASQVELASLHCTSTLKTKVFRSLRVYTEQRQRYIANKIRAEQFHIRKMVQRSWDQWLLRCEHCNEIKMLPQTRRARNHCSSVLLGKAITIWKSYILWRRHRKQEYATADEHFKSVALPKCFAAMQEFVVIQRYKHSIQEKAVSFRRENLLAMVFYKWLRGYHLSQDTRMLERVAILHNEEVTKRKMLKMWQARTADRIRHFSQEHTAVLHYRHRLLSTAFVKWKSRRDNTLLSAHQSRCASQHHSHGTLKKIWSAWTRYVMRRRASHQKRSFADHHYHRIVLQKTLQAWKVYHCHASVKIAKKTRAKEFHRMLLKRHVLGQWYTNVQFLRLQKNLEQHATAHFRTTTTRKCFSLWRDRTVVSVEEAQREDERVREAVQHLSVAKAYRVFISWRELTSCALVKKLKADRAERHSARAVLRKCFSAWHNQYRVALKKQLLQRQCVWFQNTRLLSTFYSKWRVEFMGAVLMRQKSTLALWQWSQALQRKVLAAWLFYTLNRRRKVERYSLAMERYRSRLLTLGVAQWIKVASAMRAQRSEDALQQQAKSARCVWQCVRRCALHWRRVARDRRRGRVAVADRPEGPAGTRGTRRETDMPVCTEGKLQISDRMSHVRPQPRKPAFLRTRAPPSETLEVDTVPRVFAPLPPPSPPILYSNRRDSSFTFLPSTCSGETSTLTKPNLRGSPVPEDSKLPPSHQEHHGLPVAQQPTDTTTLGTTAQRQTHMQLETHHSEPHPLLPPSASKDVRPGCDMPTNLNDPTVQTEIIHMRNELKRYHDLRVKQRLLEEQVSQAIEGDAHEHATELQRELASAVEVIQAYKPRIRTVATRISQLLSQC